MDPVRFTSGPQQPSPGASPAAATRNRSGSMTAGTAAAGTAPSKEVGAGTQRGAIPANGTTQVSATDLRELLERTGDYIDPARRSLSFEIREELVRQIPADEMIRVANVMREIAEQGEQRTAAGLLLNEQA